MSFFGSIMSKIFGTTPAAAAEAAPASAGAPPAKPIAPADSVDVAAILDEMNEKIPQELDWRVKGPVQEIPAPDRVLPALAVSAMTRAQRDLEPVRRAIAGAETGRLITAEGVGPLLDEVLRRERPAQVGPAPQQENTPAPVSAPSEDADGPA